MKNIIKNILLVLFAITLFPVNANSSTFIVDYPDNYIFKYKCVTKSSQNKQDLKINMEVTQNYLRLYIDDNYIEIDKKTSKLNHNFKKSTYNDGDLKSAQAVFKLIEQANPFKKGEQYSLGKKFSRNINMLDLNLKFDYKPLEFLKYNKMLTLKVLYKTTFQKDNVSGFGDGYILIHLGSGMSVKDKFNLKIKNTNKNFSTKFEQSDAKNCELLNEENVHPNFYSTANSLNIQIKEDNLLNKKYRMNNSSSISNKTKPAEIKCKDLGFKKGTESFGMCVFKLMD